MPEESDRLAGYLVVKHRQSLEEILLNYRITMISCLHWNNPAPWSTPWRECPDTFLLFPEQGEVRVTLKGRQFTIRPGQFLMLAEHTRHALELPGSLPRIRQFALHCHIHDRWSRPLAARFSSPVGHLPSRSRGLAALRELTCLMGHNPKAAHQRGKTFLRELLGAQLSAGVRLTSEPAAGDPRIGVVLEIMDREHGASGLSVESLARRVGISSVQLRKLFRLETGVSPRRFLITFRLQRAARLLQASTASIKEVAALCGFASDHYFHLTFRRKFSCTPSEYRRNTRSQV